MCDHDCEPLNGTYSCTCIEGYVLGADDVTCEEGESFCSTTLKKGTLEIFYLDNTSVIYKHWRFVGTELDYYPFCSKGAKSQYYYCLKMVAITVFIMKLFKHYFYF